VTDFWEHGHETPDIIKEGISFIWRRDEYDLLQDSTAAFPELLSSRNLWVSKNCHVSSPPCSRKSSVSRWSPTPGTKAHRGLGPPHYRGCTITLLWTSDQPDLTTQKTHTLSGWCVSKIKN
jgi:hypothetical protein